MRAPGVFVRARGDDCAVGSANVREGTKSRDNVESLMVREGVWVDVV
jgi:hypothetical protein